MNELDHEQSEDDFSLADLAGLDAGQIAEVRFEVLPAGVYGFRGIEAKLEETENKDGERRFIMIAQFEVTEVKSVVNRDYRTEEAKAELIGRKHREKIYVVPAKAAEGLGQIRAFIGDLGLPNEGPYGGVEGAEPGIIDGIVDHEFTAKIKAGTYNGSPTANLMLERRKK